MLDQEDFVLPSTAQAKWGIGMKRAASGWSSSPGRINMIMQRIENEIYKLYLIENKYHFDANGDFSGGSLSEFVW